VIRPRVDRIRIFQLRQLDLPIQEGEQATVEKLGLIREVIAKYSAPPEPALEKQPAA
jgi:hypothetical protein